jgi:putative MATE family efflux protein
VTTKAFRPGIREQILRGPVLPTLLRLAWPTTVVSLQQVLITALEVFYIGFLGVDALAGAALVFPLQMLMASVATGGMGGGVSSAVARAIGAGRQDEADALIWHALVLAIVMGAFFTALIWLGGPILFSALSKHSAASEQARAYSRAVFGGAIAMWMFTLLMAALRGAGDVKFTAKVSGSAIFVLVPLSPLLIFGLGPFKGFGIAGAGLALVTYYVFATAFIVRALLSGRRGVTLAVSPLDIRRFGEIFRVGLPSSLGSLQGSLNTVLVAAAVAHFGDSALAGYGIASRVDYVMNPLMFGLGSAMITMIGANVGAGSHERARRVTWSGAALATGISGLIGLSVALFSSVWLALFTRDPTATAHGVSYFRTVGPFYAMSGFGLSLYFARQGMGRAFLPFLAGTFALLIAAGGGWLAVGVFHAPITTLFWIIAISKLAYAAVNLAVMLHPNQDRALASAAVRNASSLP